jgi:signal transduction histidine kinase/ActR/RegA family two-component response regulator
MSDDEELRLRSVAMQNAQAILIARQRAEQELLHAKQDLERKTSELAHSLALLRATFESTWDGILQTASDGAVIGYNQQFVDMWRIPESTIREGTHRAINAFISPQFTEPERFGARVAEIYERGERESYDLLELRDGRVFERYSKTLLVDDHVAGRVWSFRDISERRSVEMALRDETRQLELLNQTGTIIAAHLDLQELLQSITDVATQLSGAQFGAFFYNARDEHGDVYQLHALSGVPREVFETLGHPRPTALFGPVFRGERIIRCDDVLADPRYGKWPPHYGMPAGHPPVRSFLAAPVASRSGAVIGALFFGHAEPGVFTEHIEGLLAGVAAQAGVAVDNARLYASAQDAAEERQRLLDSERAARTQAERMSEMKDEFLATLSHELRTPLSAIVGWSQVLRRSASDTDRLQKGLEAIERNARVQTQLIEDLLDMSRITSGKVRLDVQPVQPISFIEAAIETVRPAADAKGIRLERVLDPTAGPIAGDPNRLQQVIWNLLSNAIKFTPKDGRIQVLLVRADSQIHVSVADTGIGMDPDFVAHAFDRFRQADPSTTRRYGGLGLGLSIVKHLVELHGGTVRASSDGPDRGSTFTVRLPLPLMQQSSAEEFRFHAETSQHTADFKPVDLSGVKVLAVDDEPDARSLMEHVLGECKADVLLAANAEDALAILERDRPHVLVSDVGMPGVDGYELVRRVRALGEARGGRLPAIALTAFARSEDRTRALRAGFHVHLSKPIEPSELVATVASILGRSDPQD